MLAERSQEALGRALLQFLQDAAGARHRFYLEEQVKMVRQEDPPDEPKTHLAAKLPEDFDKDPTEALTRKKPRAVISATGEELQLSGHKMAFASRHGER